MDVYLGLGTNQGDKVENLKNAVVALSNKCGNIVAESSIYQSPSWGFKAEESFYNSVILIRTELSPKELLYECKNIEVDLGRQKKTKIGYESRIIDLDILLYDSIVINTTELTIPHPLMGDRKFVLQPLLELLMKRNVNLEVLYKMKLSNCNDQSVLEIV
jgi:2-amino-4-hydroxy-6-hydroxymethyldihydropteridine diphosphokinase